MINIDNYKNIAVGLSPTAINPRLPGDPSSPTSPGTPNPNDPDYDPGVTSPTGPTGPSTPTNPSTPNPNTPGADNDVDEDEEEPFKQPTSNAKDSGDFDYIKYYEENNIGITKNRQLSYFGNGIQTLSSSDLKGIVDKIQQSVVDINKAVNGFPPGYYDYIVYPHRQKAYKFIDNLDKEDNINSIFRIGDCYFVIPPEFITVTTSSKHDSIQGLRHSGSIQKKHGYAQREIQVSLILNGMNQINGYKVESPFDYPYYVDGLRTLISQFKYTPFLPIENALINLVHGIYTVALRNISVETIEGFPETLNVVISMQEFNVKSYIGEDESMFGEIIDWDLYRYYVQQPLREKHKNYLSKITTPKLTNDFKFKILKQDALGGYKLDKYGNIVTDKDGNPILLNKSDTNYYEDDITIDITDEKYYKEVLSSDDDLKFTGLNFSMSNIMPLIQMSDHEIPTAQYLGSTDTTFSLNFETKDYNVIMKINDMTSQNLSLIRDNKQKSGIGFMKIDNELIKLTGTNFLLISNINISTVPGFPGLHSVNLECISYDSNQKENEKLIALNPFPDNREGVRSDLISQETPGFSNKIRQDAEIELKLLELEMYPDLCLPTYSEVDSAISSIRSFRTKNNLFQQLSFSSYPRTKNEMPGNLTEGEYAKYVDPDFYVMYTSKLSDMKTSGTPTNATKDTFSKIPFTLLDNGVVSVNVKEFADSAKISSILEQAKGNILDIFPFTQPKPDIVTEPEYAYGYEPHIKTRVNKSFLQNKDGDPDDNDSFDTNVNTGGSNNSASEEPKSVKRKYGNPFVDLACDRADSGCGYVYGTSGEIYTKDIKSRLESTYPYDYYNGGENETSQWLGKQVFDCSGLICWALRKIGLKGDGFRISSGGFGSHGTSVSSSEIIPGDIFYDGTHCGICLDNGKTVEAMWSNYGVRYGTVNTSRYNFVRLSGLKEANQKFLNSNKNFYESSSSNNGGGGSGGGSQVQEQMSLKSKSIINSKAPMTMESGAGSTSSKTTSKKVVLANFGDNNACDGWNTEITTIADEMNFDPNFIKTIMMIESGGNPNAVSSYDPPNIVGLMQIYLKYHKDKFDGTNYFDPLDNMRAGCRIWKDYGGADWVSYDLEKSICCYNAGPGTAQSVYFDGQPMPTETRNYIEKYKKYYGQLVSNGASAGSRITLTIGGMTPTGDGSGDNGGSSNNGSKNTYTESDFKNPNSGTKHGDSVDGIDLNSFGKSSLTFISSGTEARGKYFEFSHTVLGKKIKQLNAKMVVEWMFHDMVQYSNKGRLSRAFPSFIFIIADEQTDWIDRKKLWTNYYIYRSVLDISIHQAYDNPISTAKVTLTNFNNNLTKIVSKATTASLLDNGFVKCVYELTGAIIDEKITNEMIKLKNMLRNEIYLYEGARVHIRMGYGSNPSKYPTNFNGTITNIEYGEIISLIAQSDGIELVNQPLTDKTNQTNKDIKLPEETSNMIARMFVARENDFLYGLTFGNMKINSKNGIEHFGMYYDGIDGLDIDLTIGDQSQYDIVQNIYKGTYKGVPFSALSFLNFDGESNWRFFASGKNVWDIVKMCEKSMPEFIAYPRYFGFDSRIFYGLPSWLYNYKYEVNKDNGDLYIRSKTFTQVHDVCSVDSIIDNTITIDTRNLATNFIGTYTLGGDLATTPVIMSDNTIDWSRQKTRTIDTTSVQDFSWIPSIIDKFLSWSGTFDNGKELAIRVCISELQNSWRETYSGNLLILGQPEINTYDWIYLDDTSLHMSGMVSVREVIHSMSVSTGFITSIVPGMITFNTIKQSGLENSFRSTMYVLNAIAHWKFAKFISVKTLSLISKAYSASKFAKYIVGGGEKVISFTATKGKDIYEMFRAGDTIVDISKFIKKVDTVVDIAKGSKFFSVGKEAVSVVMGVAAFTPQGLVVIAAMLVIDFLIGWLITALVDMFAYKNCITIHPLIISMPDGTAKAYAGNIKGGRKILPMATATSENS